MSSCPICRNEASTVCLICERFHLAHCPKCSHKFIGSGLVAGELADAYEHHYYEAVDEDSPSGYRDYLADTPARIRGFGDRLAAIERLVDSRGRLLDFGCAVGLFVKVAKDAGWDAIGYERSKWAAKYGRETFGVDIVVGDSNKFDALAQPFDVVTIWDALEHLESPRDVLAQIAGWLRPGGLLALNTVAASSLGARLAGVHWRHISPPHHLQYFSRRSLRYLLESTGFRVARVEGQGVMLGADRRRTRLGPFARVLERCVTHWRMRPLARSVDLLDEVEILAYRA